MKVEATESVEVMLEELMAENRTAARQLALLMLDLGQEPRPASSRALPSSDQAEDRVMYHNIWQVLYRLGPDKITIAELSRRQ